MRDQSAPDGEAVYTQQGRMVTDHWARKAVTYEGALQRLQSEGIDPESVTVEDLYPLDMIHMGGLGATDALSVMVDIRRDHAVLDVGSGVGGPARRMASRYGASVWGVELSESLYHTAVRLTKLVGLQEHVRFKHASALDLPFPSETFDVVVLQHIAMQIAEKEQLFEECARVVKPGGCLAMHEIFAGNEEPLTYPLAWATEPAMSALEPFDQCAARLARLGFQVGPFVDVSEEGRQFHQHNVEAAEAALAEPEGTEEPSAEVLEARLRAARAMEKNIRIGAIRVGMVVSRKMEN
jgi:ubiquinone/menaquinone biosynthesis C-methylase UbiE